MNEPLTIEINGQAITADMATWRRVREAINDRTIADLQTWEQARRDAGQVWYALYMRYQSPHAEECFSRKDAEAVMEWDDQANYGIVNPDGKLDTAWLYHKADPAEILSEFADVMAEAGRGSA